MKTYKEMHGNIKTTGELIGETYITFRKPNHFMVKFNGFGISDDILKTLNFNGCKKVVIIYEGKTKKKYSCDFKLFLTSQKTHIYKENDLQRFVSVKEMKEEDGE